MLTVTVTYKNKEVTEVDFIGHALYDDYGKDIVCAAASSILITTVNGILSFDEEYLEVKHKKDRITVKVLRQDSITKTLLNNMMKLLVDLETDYPKNIKIN